ncbi:MAG: hypothetical protein FJ265_11965, partial [Planctomycetes bacterium]|nr:hypothetical protein [Planctomycetota bacterium]
MTRCLPWHGARLRCACLLSGLVASCSAPPAPPAEPTAQAPPAAAAPPTPAAPAALLPPDTTTRTLPNGLLVAIGPPVEGIALLQIGLPAGADSGPPGLAELAAEALVASGDASAGRANLRRALADLGGTLHVEVGPASTWITLRMPRREWPAAQRALAAALAQPTLSRHQLERVRDDFVMQRIAAIWSNPERDAMRVFVLGDTGTADYVAALLDRDVSEVPLFQTRWFRPEGAVLTARVPGTAEQVGKELAAGIGEWRTAGAGQQPAPGQPRRLQPGVYWNPAPPLETCRAAVILPLPEPADPEAADLFVLHAVLTLDGCGGRLEQLQRERGLAHVRWRSQFLQFAETAALVLTAETTSAEAVRLWQVVQGARRSLLELPPTPAELEIALRRAALSARLGEHDSATRLRNQADALRHGRPVDVLQRRLGLLGAPGAFDARATARRYLERPAAMVVFGGVVPADAAGVSTFDLLPAGAMARIAAPGNPVAQASAAVPWLERAIEAAGGRALLLQLDGFDAAATLRAEAAPVATESTQWRGAGTLIRRRELLGGAVATRIAQGKGTEQAGGTPADLDAREVARLQREQQRHPLLLLAAHARGQLPFRPIAQRAVGDRELMVLEAIGGGFDRLRIHVDAASHLVRTVEVWETTGDGAVAHV